VRKRGDLVFSKALKRDERVDAAKDRFLEANYVVGPNAHHTCKGAKDIYPELAVRGTRGV
jgi:hypothetical protein